MILPLITKRSLLTISLGATLFVPAPATAQLRCRVLCVPTLNLEPTITLEPLGTPPRVSVDDGPPEREARETVPEIVLALDVPTSLPRLAFTFEGIFVADSPAEVESELNLIWLAEHHTGGWVESHVDIVDQYSRATRPGAGPGFTHKLDLELDTSLAVFRWLPEDNWLHEVEFETSLDYLATGLPRAGDVVDGTRFLDRASPWSFSFVFKIPVLRGQ